MSRDQAMKTQSFNIIVSAIFLMLSLAMAQLSPNFYRNTCPNLEFLVRSAVTNRFRQNFATAPATLRLFFHDCFVRGCDASVLLASTLNNMAERDHVENQVLVGDGIDTVIRAKAAVDSDPRCRYKVSCADILALAARDVISLTGGPYYTVELGRRDGRISNIAAAQVGLPSHENNLDQLNALFGFHGLTQTDMIALSGAHSIGFGHCNRLSKRIHNFSPRFIIDPTLNFGYALQLRRMCPVMVDPRVTVNMDPNTPRTLDNVYYKNLQQGRGLFNSDQILFNDIRSKPTVNLFASSPTAFQRAFVTAITKLGKIGVLTPPFGEIRQDCTRLNRNLY